MKKNKSLIAIVTLLLLVAIVTIGKSVSAEKTIAKMLSTNEDFINGLERKSDLSSAKEVFRYVFANLNDEVIVYPTENYYYFQMSLQGKVIKGNIGFMVDYRERGEITISYDEVTAFSEAENNLSGEGILSKKDGVEVKKITPFRYEITFQGKTVAFNFNQIEQKLPERIKLMPDEIFIGHSFDESGLKFFLVFNQKFNHFYWLLDEEEAMPESLTAIDDEILIGKRTAFAFYNDKENSRKILIGVSKREQSKNSWYDGPFDQLPDNYIAAGQVEVQKYMEAAYPYAKGNINKFGVFLDEPESRVAISPYASYSKSDELKLLINAAKKSAGRNKSGFYCEITSN